MILTYIISGCYIDGEHYREGSQIPSESGKACEICYCIRNSSACIIQECALSVSGCQPIYQKGECCPSSYKCGKCFRTIFMLLHQFLHKINLTEF